MEYTKKFIYQSNQWYNDGLRRANIRDLSGAITSLKKSLQYNRDNIAARNLLGLIYYGQGEVAEALVEWIISKNIKSHENIADYYIRRVQETPSELEAMNQAIKKFNQCLVYCQQDGEDLAVIQLKKVIASHPTFLKAHQLLALLYLRTEQYAKARQVLRKAHRIDATNDITLRYMHELTQLHNKKAEQLKEERNESISYNLGNETIIQPVSSSLKDNAATLTIVNILLGMLIGAAIVWFLVVPAMNHHQSAKANKEVVAYSDQIAARESEISTLKKQVEGFKEKEKQLEEEKQKAANTQANYETLVDVMTHFHNEKYDTATLIDELLALPTESLGEKGKAKRDEMVNDLFPKQCEKQYGLARQSYWQKNYRKAVGHLEMIMKMNETYADGKALSLLAECYEKSGDKENATAKYNRVIELYPDSKLSKDATEALNKMNAPAQPNQ